MARNNLAFGCKLNKGKQDMKVFADESNLDTIFSLYEERTAYGIEGFTTNPSLMRKGGVTNYKTFLNEVSTTITDIPVSFEVISDDPKEIERQARVISDFGENIWVKIPIINSRGEYLDETIRKVLNAGCRVNITAVMTDLHVEKAVRAMDNDYNCPILSVFAGRITDIEYCIYDILAIAVARKNKANYKVLWASTRELWNFQHAALNGCDIITASTDLIKKRQSLIGKEAGLYAKETVAQFILDAETCGYTL